MNLYVRYEITMKKKMEKKIHPANESLFWTFVSVLNVVHNYGLHSANPIFSVVGLLYWETDPTTQETASYQEFIDDNENDNK